MTNYHKKRQRQAGRQRQSTLKSNIAYQKGYFEGQSDVIEKMISSGILPPVTYHMPKITEEEFRKEWSL